MALNDHNYYGIFSRTNQQHSYFDKQFQSSLFNCKSYNYHHYDHRCALYWVPIWSDLCFRLDQIMEKPCVYGVFYRFYSGYFHYCGIEFFGSLSLRRLSYFFGVFFCQSLCILHSIYVHNNSRGIWKNGIDSKKWRNLRTTRCLDRGFNRYRGCRSELWLKIMEKTRNLWTC